MAESLLFNLGEKIIVQIGSLAIQELRLAWGVKADLKRLQNTLSTVNAVILDAEEKKQAEDRQLADWVRKLKNVLFDADDVIDEFEYDVLRRQILIRGSIMKKVRNFFTSSNPIVFRLKMGQEVKAIRVRLDEIAADKTNFHLSLRSIVRNEREMTHSFVLASDVIGRDGDKENLVQTLMNPRDDEGISVIPIVGIGGLGKTTLAKFVYNDERVVAHFQLRMWICVYKDFEVKRLVREILQSASGSVEDENLTLDQLQTGLRRALVGKRFLLVLDDVWNKDPKKWNDLKDLLLGGGGSKIVVTTRGDDIASLMGTVQAYKLGGLSFKECLYLFEKLAFRVGEQRNYPDLVEMGREIVSKCQGVPLAVRTLGSLLFTKTDKLEWLRVRDSELWELEQTEGDILPALRLCYNEFPPHLKQCFSYCAVFPKNYTIYRNQLIQLWMAEGFILPSSNNHGYEDIGISYFNYLCSRSFFQELEEFDYAGEVSCKMHDLVHDLAFSVTRSDFFTCHPADISRDLSDDIRHLSFTDHFQDPVISLCKPRKLRTLFFPMTEFSNYIPNSVFSLSYMRVLVLENLGFELLPSSIGNLKHLRYLNIRSSNNLKRLPNSICKLHNLQTLLTGDCTLLKKWPEDIGNLISLRHLEITTRQKRFPEKGIGCLTSLHSLWFVACDSLEYLPQGIGNLTSLRQLSILECRRLISLPEEIQCLAELKILWIFACPELRERCLPDIGEDYQKIAHIPVFNYDEIMRPLYRQLYELRARMVLRKIRAHIQVLRAASRFQEAGANEVVNDAVTLN